MQTAVAATVLPRGCMCPPGGGPAESVRRLTSYPAPLTFVTGARVGVRESGTVHGPSRSPCCSCSPCRDRRRGARARGSVGQVHVSGARPGARMMLGDRRGRRTTPSAPGRSAAPSSAASSPALSRARPARPRALEALGAALDQALPAADPQRRVRLPDHARRHQARDRRPPPERARALPTLVEYSGYGYANPDGAPELDRGDREPARLRGGRRQHARHRLLGRRVRLLRAAPGAGRLRRRRDGRAPAVGGAQQGRDDGRLLRRDQPALRRRDPAAEPGGDRAAVGDRQHRDDAVPGGILNTGFALSWAKDRVHDAKPASATGGQAWALKRIRGGDRSARPTRRCIPRRSTCSTRCGEQPLRAQGSRPAVADPFVHKIPCPSTSPASGPTSRRAGTARRSPPRFTGTRASGHVHQRHAHRLARPGHVQCAGTTSSSSRGAAPAAALPAERAAAPVIFRTAMGVPGVTLPDDPIQAQPTYAAARAAFEALPPVRILFDNGAGGATPGAPVPGSSSSFARFPLPGTQRPLVVSRAPAARSPKPRRPAARRRRLHVGAGPRGRPRTSPATRARGRRAVDRDAAYGWSQQPAGTALSYVTAPLTADTAVVGGGALAGVDPLVRAAASISRPRSRRSGPTARRVRAERLAARERAQARPRQEHAARAGPEPAPQDAAPLPKGRWAKVTVPLYYQGHVYRAGSRLRVTLAAPRGDQPVWELRQAPAARAARRCRSSRAPSRAVAARPAGGRRARRADRAAPCPGLRASRAGPTRADSARSQRRGLASKTVRERASSRTPCSRSHGSTLSKTSVIDQSSLTSPCEISTSDGLRGNQSIDAQKSWERKTGRRGRGEQLGGRRVALLERQVEVEAVAVEADPDAVVEQALDVVEVVAVAGVGDLDLLRVDALLEEDLDLARAGVRRRSRVGHDRRAGLQARARDTRGGPSRRSRSRRARRRRTSGSRP